MKGYVVYPTYRVINGNPFICLFGRLENGQSFLTLTYYKPHFFIRAKDLKKAQKVESFESEKTNLTNFKKEKVAKIITNLPKDVPKLRISLEQEGIECYEADIKFAYRFLFDNNINGCINIEGDYESSDRLDRIYKEPKITPAEFEPKLKIAAIDIETDPKASEIYSISIATKDYKTAIIRTGKKIDNSICCKSEEQLLEEFKKKIIEIDPDVITGWSLIDFDLKTIFERCKEYSLPPNFGRDNTPCKLKFEEGFFRDSKADFPGRAVLDALPLIRASALAVKDYKLDTIAETVLGKKKSLQFKNKGEEIQNLFLNDPQKLADYNIQDSELVLEILEKSKVFDLALKKSLLSGLPVDRGKASIASLDSLYIKEARKRGLVVPSAKYNVKEKGITGGYVKEPQPGIYENVGVLDFKSVDYSEPVYLLDNTNEVRIMPIGEFVDSSLSKGKNSFRDIEISLPPKGWKVLCFDKNYKVCFSKISQVSRHLNNEPLYEIITSSGRRIKITKHHSLFSLDKNFKPVSTMGSQLKKGECIVVPLRSTLPTHQKEKKLNLLPLLKSLPTEKLQGLELCIPSKYCLYKHKRRIKYFKEIYSKKAITAKELEKGLGLRRLSSYPILREFKKESLISIKKGQINLTSKGSQYYHNLLLLSKLHKHLPTSRYCSVNLPRLIEHIDPKNSYFLRWKLGYKSSTYSSRISLLLPLEPLCSLLGYYASEGCCVKSKRKDRIGHYQYKVHITARDLHTKIVEATNELGLTAYNKKEGFVTFSSKVIYFLFAQVFKTGRNAHNKKVPSFVFNEQDELKNIFLKSYFEGDGHKYSHAQQFGTASEDLVNGIALLNMSLGNIGFKIGKYGSFFHCFINDDKFSAKASKRINYSFRIPKETIPQAFFDKYKREEYNKTVNIQKLTSWLKSRGIKNHIFNGDLGVDTIKSIKKKNPSNKFVYDIGVNPTQNFICGTGGIVAHNSLYPSIIRTFNIDPSSYVEKCEGKNLIKAPNNACFKNEEGILPSIIQTLWGEREKARKEKDELVRYAIKILMNTFFGVMASPNCRFFNLNIANAITHFGQSIIKLTAQKIEEGGYKVIYSDTDSCFVVTKAKSLEEAERIGKKLEHTINKFYKRKIKGEYKRESYLELEFDKCFVKFLMPKIRGGEKGAKKRYAGLILVDGKEKIEFTGMEAIRADWTELAQKFQHELLNRVFHDQEVNSFIKGFVTKLKKGELDDLLVYKKSIRKELKEYTLITPPHVKAARKMEKIGSRSIEYVMTEDGPEPIQDIKHKIDYDHYVNKQLKPIADSILCFFNKNFEEVLGGSKQTKLFGY